MNDEKTRKLEAQIEKLGGAPNDWDFENDTEKKPEPVFWDDMEKMSFPDDRWLVKDIFPKEGVSMLASVSGEGKSLIVMHLAKCISEGSAWFGNQRFQTQQSKVLYINLEMSLSEMQRRGRLMGFQSGNENLIILNEDDFNLNGATVEDLKYRWLLSFILEQKIKVVIVDTFRPATGGMREEKAEEVRKFFQKFQVIKNAGVSVIFTEHLRKAIPQEGKVPKKEQVLGSQDKVANLEILLMIKKDETTGETRLYQRKNRLGREIQPFAIKITDGTNQEGKEVLNFNYVGEVDDDTSKKDEAKELILNILSSGENKTTNELIWLLKKQEVGQKNVRQALRELQNHGEVDMFKTGKQNTYFLPREEKGLEPVLTHEDGNIIDNF